MKYYILLLLACSLMAKAQDKVTFDYDSAGNQIKRELCINCTNPTYKMAKPEEVVALVEEEDLQKFFPEDVISYYPNPVKEELFLTWELANDNTVTSLQVYNLNGQILKTFSHFESNNKQTIPFQAYPTGTYIINLIYSNGEAKTIRIIKK